MKINVLALPIVMGVAALTGCAGKRPDPDAERAIQSAVGEQTAIAFRVEGGPIDEPGAGSRLSIADALGRALMTDPSLQASLARVRIAMAEADQSRVWPNPVLGVVLRWGQGPVNVEASLAQDVVQMLQTPRRASAADNRLRKAGAESVTTALDVVAAVERQYRAVQAQEARLAIALQRRSSLEETREVASSLLAAGEMTRSELTQIEVEVGESELDITAAALAARSGRLRLARLIGEPSGGADWELDEFAMEEGSALGDEAAWIQSALDHRPEIKSAEWQQRALGDDVRLATIWDGLSAGAEAERDGGDWVAGPAVSTPVPIFDTGAAATAKAQAVVIEARHERTAITRKVVEEVRVAYRQAAESRLILERAQLHLLPAVLESQRQAEAKFAAGETDRTSTLRAARDVLNARTRVVELMLLADLAQIDLHRAVGGGGIAAQVNSPVATSRVLGLFSER